MNNRVVALPCGAAAIHFLFVHNWGIANAYITTHCHEGKCEVRYDFLFIQSFLMLSVSAAGDWRMSLLWPRQYSLIVFSRRHGVAHFSFCLISKN